MENNKLTAAEIEKAKTDREKAEDISYTINHSIVCTATDFIDPFTGNYIQKLLGNKSQLKNAAMAEIIGDFGAVPLTIGMQRFFPSAISMVGKMAEPVLGRVFMKGAERAANKWADEQGYSTDSKEYEDKKQKIYQYEMKHLPQAIMWTVSAAGLNIASQRLLGNNNPIHHIAAGKIGGSMLTAAIVLGGRSIFPRHAEKIDHFSSEKIVMPIEKKIYHVLGEEYHEHLGGAYETYEKHEEKEKVGRKYWTNQVKFAKNNFDNKINAITP